MGTFFESGKDRSSGRKGVEEWAPLFICCARTTVCIYHSPARLRPFKLRRSSTFSYAISIHRVFILMKIITSILISIPCTSFDVRVCLRFKGCEFTSTSFCHFLPRKNIFVNSCLLFFPQWDLILKERICNPRGTKFLPLRFDSHGDRRTNMQNGKVAFP